MQNKKFDITFSPTYKWGVDKLQQQAGESHPQIQISTGDNKYRPLTVKETMQARVENPELMNYGPLNTITTLTGQKDKVKANPLDEGLMYLDGNWNSKPHEQSQMDSMEGTELDLKKASPIEVILYAMGGPTDNNMKLLSEYQQLIGDLSEKKKKLDIYLPSSLDSETRQVFLGGMKSGPCINGTENSGGHVQFLTYKK